MNRDPINRPRAVPDETPRITDDLRMAMARVWDEWADLHGVAAPAHIVDTWLSVTIAADALDSEVAALTAQRDAAQAAALVAIKGMADLTAEILAAGDESEPPSGASPVAKENDHA